MEKGWFHQHKKAITVAFVGIVGFLFAILIPVISNIPGDFWKKIGYPGLFLLSFIGASSVIIPIPYTVILLAISSAFDPILLTISAGLGSALGELVGYLLGYLGRSVVEKNRRRQLDAMLRIFKRFGVFAIFLFAFTPLPDDLLFIPLGLMHYSLWKTFAASLAGKLSMLFIIANVGKAIPGLPDWLTVLTAIFLVLIIVAIFKIDWVKLAEKYAPKTGKRKQS